MVSYLSTVHRIPSQDAKRGNRPPVETLQETLPSSDSIKAILLVWVFALSGCNSDLNCRRAGAPPRSRQGDTSVHERTVELKSIPQASNASLKNSREVSTAMKNLLSTLTLAAGIVAAYSACDSGPRTVDTVPTPIEHVEAPPPIVTPEPTPVAIPKRTPKPKPTATPEVRSLQGPLVKHQPVLPFRA